MFLSHFHITHTGAGFISRFPISSAQLFLVQTEVLVQDPQRYQHDHRQTPQEGEQLEATVRINPTGIREVTPCG
jgi:hypothetical protein